MHNHPSGCAEPSHADETLTQALKQALALVDVRVLDHFVVGGSAVLSFAERGLRAGQLKWPSNRPRLALARLQREAQCDAKLLQGILGGSMRAVSC